MPEEQKLIEVKPPLQYADIPLRRLQISRRGKGHALNIGLKQARYEFLCVLDADCVLDDQAIPIIMPSFEDEDVIAVGGKLRAMSEKKNLLTFWQRVEYMKTFNIWRPIFDLFNANCLISGAYGVFRKDYVRSIGGYDDNTVGEDMQLVLSMHYVYREYGKHVCYDPESICYTGVPTTIRRLLHQRDRWQRGLLDCIIKRNYLILNPLYGFLGLVAMPYQIIVELLGPISVLIHAVNLLCLAIGFEGWFMIYGPVKYWLGVALEGLGLYTLDGWDVYLFYLGIEVSLSCLAECLEYGKWYLFITKLPETVAATAIGIMLSVPLAMARLWGMVSFRWRRMEW